MDELKYLTNKNNIQQITVGLQKLLKTIRSEKVLGSKENQIKEIDYLRELCTSEYTNLSLLAHQAFVRLVEDGTIEAAACLSMFMTMLPNTKYNQYTSITEGVVDLLLLDLKRRSALTESTKAYACPFGLKAPQHPIIMLMQKNDSNLNDLTNKINGICNHHDKEIRQHSIEFLRPVFLYTLCNIVTVPDSMTIWTCLLSQVKRSNKAGELVNEILCYRKSFSAAATLTTSLLLSDAVVAMVANDNTEDAIQFSFYLTAILNDLLTYGYDPRPGFRIIRQAISDVKQVDDLTWDLFLMLLNQSLHNVSPVYLSDVVRLLKLIIITRSGGNRITRFMILDGLIVWIANFSLVPADGLHGIKELIDFIINSDGTDSPPKPETSNKPSSCAVKFYHPSLAIGFQLALLSQRIDGDLRTGETNNLNEFVDAVQAPSQIRFGHQIHLFLRGIFLHSKVPPQQCTKVLNILLKIVRDNQDVATGLLLPLLFKLSREKEPTVQMELLRGLTQFAVIKENIPTILNTLNSLTSGALRPLSLDLYLRLWKQENRTYPFLHKLLHDSREKDKSSYELTVAKAFTIKEICELKPTQHGTDLVVHLSNILNHSSGSEGETSTTIAIEAIIILCKSHTINIASTWTALSQKFENEKRKRPLMTLCKFFGQVPLLRSPTMEYEQLNAESIAKLWHYIEHSDCSEVISSALTALQSFDYCGLALAQIPEIFRQNLIIPSAYTKTITGDVKPNPVDVLDYIPGQCWVQLIQKVNPSATAFASDLVSHYIHNEIESYRSGVYHMPEGKPEPNNLKQLHHRSPLRYIVEYLTMEAKKSSSIAGNDQRVVLLNCLRCLSNKFPKPIPPLDMYFLIHFMNDDIDMKRYCIRILANQVIQSGTAKNLLENYVSKFGEEQMNDLREVQIILDVLVDVMNGISTEISEKFMKELFEFSFRRVQSEPIIFESLLEAIKPIFTEACRNEDAMLIVTGIVESYFVSIDPNTKIFQKFIEVCEHLPSSRLDEMTTAKNSELFRKAALVRCHLAANSRRLDNSLFWLNPIVDSVSKFDSDQTFVLRHIAIVLHRYENDKNVSNWTMEIQSRVQAALLEKSTNAEFLMDLFMLCIVVCSGYATLFGSIDLIASCRQSRLDGFPAALHILSERAFWRDCTVRIFEFLFHVYTNTNLSSSFIAAAKNSLICTKNDFYFTQKSNWIKYTGLRR